jgi:hypothetical protein
MRPIADQPTAQRWQKTTETVNQLGSPSVSQWKGTNYLDDRRPDVRAALPDATAAAPAAAATAAAAVAACGWAAPCRAAASSVRAVGLLHSLHMTFGPAVMYAIHLHTRTRKHAHTRESRRQEAERRCACRAGGASAVLLVAESVFALDQSGGGCRVDAGHLPAERAQENGGRRVGCDIARFAERRESRRRFARVIPCAAARRRRVPLSLRVDQRLIEVTLHRANALESLHCRQRFVVLNRQKRSVQRRQRRCTTRRCRRRHISEGGHNESRDEQKRTPQLSTRIAGSDNGQFTCDGRAAVCDECC